MMDFPPSNQPTGSPAPSAESKGGARARVTASMLRRFKQEGRAICMVTASDATSAAMLALGGVDVILVGDSLGMVVQGHDSTLPVTIEHMRYHTSMVARGLRNVCAAPVHLEGSRSQSQETQVLSMGMVVQAPASSPSPAEPTSILTDPHREERRTVEVRRPLLVADLPFLSVGVTDERSVLAAGSLMQDGADAVKLEGGEEMAPLVRQLVRLGMPVMGHVGLRPQHVHQLGGFRRQGKNSEEAECIARDAAALVEAGAFALVVEAVPPEVAVGLAESTTVPIIGIAAGPDCDGQVLVGHDLLGMTPGGVPAFVQPYAAFFDLGVDAVRRYCADVRNGWFGQ